jgi:amino-acid N-acetyltransferase
MIRRADANDLQAIEALLQRANLPPDGIMDQFPDTYFVAELDGRIVGAAGVEHHGDAGLLRSVVVADEYRGRGIAEGLVREQLGFARLVGIKRVFALTTTAAGYFPRLGFVNADRTSAPELLRASPQFASVCPSTAAFLEYRL